MLLGVLTVIPPNHGRAWKAGRGAVLQRGTQCLEGPPLEGEQGGVESQLCPRQQTLHTACPTPSPTKPAPPTVLRGELLKPSFQAGTLRSREVSSMPHVLQPQGQSWDISPFCLAQQRRQHALPSSAGPHPARQPDPKQQDPGQMRQQDKRKESSGMETLDMFTPPLF